MSTLFFYDLFNDGVVFRDELCRYEQILICVVISLFFYMMGLLRRFTPRNDSYV